ncbi:class I poly(R)-hydroxyalkanoic acid synthase [Ponticaulis sp.]|uniref:PHA/PHB synthase family protein n=1 Tax=Ponticaulis sp. TaxID=2020902 RepID=UPI000B6BBB86|nr:class I poly(R)-hydroxyalkanoic acid synthase [Ponticaulis sp.]MAI89359.1 class I poly(R)-hydroxyalkanoic acid synthase [Ponticaulis sp.]OUY00400.1 MAG: class I poly(R)-hydroxyalkanoic acid synthase [Hyphomonadaceae bacterium TMED5]|tara:strand:- start:2025 stop:3950 length:1926 start_codon:yes stop_codon:yes gene_type:complete
MAAKSNTATRAKKSTASAEKKTVEAENKAGGKPKPDSAEKCTKTLNEILSEANAEKLEALSKNMSEAMFESQQILRDITTANLKKGLDNTSQPDPFGAGAAWAKVGENLALHPDRLLNAQLSLWEGHLNIWRSLLVGGEAETSKDKRFDDPEWKTNPVFDVIKQTYQLNSSWLMSLIDSAEELDQETRRKATFFARQTADAFSPTNFFSTNPAALRAMLDTGGESLVEGLRLARRDIQRGHGRLIISQTDDSPFVLGENVASSKGKVVFRNALIEVLKYNATTDEVYERPLLIFPPWINKFYILDLREENSMIRWLTDQGFQVYIVSWRSADKSMSEFRWDDYVSLGAYAAIDAVTEDSGSDTVNAVGYCIGGTMLSSALARMAQENDQRVNAVTFFAAQADFVEAGDLKVFTDGQALRHIEHLIELNGGIMAGEDMAETFNYLRPADLVWKYVVDSYMLGKKPRPFDLLFWNSDQTNIPGPTHITYLEDLYSKNALSKGNFRVLGRKVNLGDIKVPALFQAGRDDHIAPCNSVYRTAKAFGGDTQFVLAGSGHIAGVVNHPAAKKYQHWTNTELPDSFSDWIQDADEHQGSWWPYWLQWLEPKSGTKVHAPEVKDYGLGDAPGTYVRKKLEELGVGPCSH